MADDGCALLRLDLEKAERLRGERLDAIVATRLADQAPALSGATTRWCSTG
jgi:hypothetical protein